MADDIRGTVFDAQTISTIRNTLKDGAGRAKGDSIKLLRLCFDYGMLDPKRTRALLIQSQGDICAQIFDADMLATLAHNRKKDDWYTRSEYLYLLTSALDHGIRLNSLGFSNVLFIVQITSVRYFSATKLSSSFGKRLRKSAR